MSSAFSRPPPQPPPQPPQPQLPHNQFFTVHLTTSLTLDRTSHAGNATFADLPPALFIPCDNPRNLVRPFVADTTDFVVCAGIFPLLVGLGVTTNALNMAVFARQGLSSRINVCLFSLAASDTGSLVFVMLSKAYALVGLVDPVAGKYWQQRHLALVLGSYLGFVAISNVITAIIAMERCLCVLNPLKAAKFFRTRHMKVLITVVAIYTLTVNNVALLVKYQTVEVRDPLTNASAFINRFTPLYVRHRLFWDVLALYSISVALRLLSLIVVILCTAAIILRLKVTATWRRSTASNMTSVEKQEVSLTRMLVTVCCVYVMCMTPSAARTLLINLLPGFLSIGYLCNSYRLSTSFTLLLEASNASINFLIYVKQSQQYRSTLRQLCLRGRSPVKKDDLHNQPCEQRQD